MPAALQPHSDNSSKPQGLTPLPLNAEGQLEVPPTVVEGDVLDVKAGDNFDSEEEEHETERHMDLATADTDNVPVTPQIMLIHFLIPMPINANAAKYT